MLAKLLIHPDADLRKQGLVKLLESHNFHLKHPDLLYFDEGGKLGVLEAKKIREHLSFKPYQGKMRAVLVVAAQDLTPEAQNALLKTLEEPPGEALIILGATSEDNLMPTVLSRCEIIQSDKVGTPNLDPGLRQQIDGLFKMDYQQRFQFIDSLNCREEFLAALTAYCTSHLSSGKVKVELAKDIVEAEKWAGQNVNIRAILEYLMLKMPRH